MDDDVHAAVGLVEGQQMTPATLDNLIANDNGLRVFHDARGRCAGLNVLALIARYGGGMEVPAIGGRSRCTRCGHKGRDTQVVAVRW